MNETIPNEPNIDLVERIRLAKANNFEEMYEESVEFVSDLKISVAETFPDEPKSFEMVPAFHELIGSGMREDDVATVSPKAKKFIEEKIGEFVKRFE